MANVDEAGGGTEDVVRLSSWVWFMSLPMDVYLAGEEGEEKEGDSVATLG